MAFDMSLFGGFAGLARPRGDRADGRILRLRDRRLERLGVLGGVGFKAGRWVDVVLMQRPLNGGETTLPVPGGLDLSES